MTKDLTRWSPFKELNRFFDEDLFSGFSPSVDIYQDKDNIIVETPLAGIKPENINISIENNVLRISGKTNDKKEISTDNYYRKELRHGSFSRSVLLPAMARAEEIRAESNNGMLKIIIPKAEESKRNKIPIEIKNK